MGVFDHISDFWTTTGGRRKFRPKELETVEIKVRIDCEGCERKVKRAVESMEGVTQVDVDPKQNKLTVIGYVNPEKVLRRVRWRTGKAAQLWPYVPYDTVSHPYVAGVYDKKAPPGYVRNVDFLPQRTTALARAGSTEEKMTNAFSDENPNSCSVM